MAGDAKRLRATLKANEGRKEGAVQPLVIKSLSAVLEDEPTGIRFYIKVVPPRRRDHK